MITTMFKNRFALCEQAGENGGNGGNGGDTTKPTNGDAPKMVTVGNRQYNAKYVRKFEGVIKSAHYLQSHRDWLVSRKAEIAKEKGTDEANKWALRAPQFKMAVTLNNIEGKAAQPVYLYNKDSDAILPSNTLYLYDYDWHHALGSNEVLRYVANEDILHNDKGDAILGCYIKGIQILVPKGTHIYNPYDGINAKGFVFTNKDGEVHDGVITVISEIKVVPYGPIQPFQQTNLILNYAVKMRDEFKARTRSIMHILDKKENVLYVDDECREMLIEDINAELA